MPRGWMNTTGKEEERDANEKSADSEVSPESGSAPREKVVFVRMGGKVLVGPLSPEEAVRMFPGLRLPNATEPFELESKAAVAPRTRKD